MPGLKYGLNMKSTVKSILEMFSGNIPGGELKDEEWNRSSTGFSDRSTGGEENMVFDKVLRI